MQKNMPFLVKSLGSVLAYVIAAKISLAFATVSGNASLIWLPGGIALAIVLLGGLRYLPSTFIGAMLASVIISNPSIINLGTAIGNTLEVYIAYTLLKRYGDFNPSLLKVKDFFVLILLGGLIAPIASATFGPLSLLASGYITLEMLIHVMAGWWRADVLGIVFLTPVTLLILQKKVYFSNEANMLEKLFLWSISFLVGQMVLVGWTPPTDLIDKPHGTAWIFLLVLWASIRTGRRNTALIQLMLLTQGLAGAHFKAGLFSNDFIDYGMINFWVFALLLAIAGLMMAILNLENSNAFQQIKQINNQFRTMMEAIPDAIFLKDGEGRWLLVNETAKKLFHLDSISWQGKTESDLAEIRPQYREIHDACLIGDNKTWDSKKLSFFNESIVDTNGIRHDYDVRKMPIFDKDSDRLSLVIIARDITAKNTTETALRDSEMRWKFALEGSGSGVWEYNFETKCNLASRHLMEMLRFDIVSPELNFPLNDWMERLHLESQADSMRAFQRVANNQSDTYVIEQQVRCEDGNYKWLFTRGMVVDKDDEGNPLVMIGTSVDITEQKLANERLRQILLNHQHEIEMQNDELRQAQLKLNVSLERHQNLYDFSPTGYLDITAQGLISEINLKATRMLNFSREQLMHRRFDQFVVDTDKFRWQQLLSGYFQYKEEEEEEEEDRFELKLIRNDGSSFSANLNCLSVEDVSGVKMLRVSLTDISKLKLSESALRIAAIAFESQEGMFVTDADNNILNVNNAFTAMTGYTAAEIVGQTPRKLSSGRHDATFYARMWQRINSNGSWQGEIWNKKKHGDIYPEHLTISAVIDEHDQVTHYVATMIDITHIKAQEAQRIADEKELRDILVREVHHRIKNNLQGVAGLLRNTVALNPTLTDPLNAAISQVYSISVIHGLQGQNSMLHIPLCELCREIALNIEPLWCTPIKINIPINIPHFQITETETVPMALILNELMSNAVKHSEEKNGITIQVRDLPTTHTVEVRIINTGSLPTELESAVTPIAGTGLKLVKSLLPDEGATLSWEQHENNVHTILLLTKPVISDNSKRIIQS